jgi:hypothetical protein
MGRVHPGDPNEKLNHPRKNSDSKIYTKDIVKNYVLSILGERGGNLALSNSARYRGLMLPLSKIWLACTPRGYSCSVILERPHPAETGGVITA